MTTESRNIVIVGSSTGGPRVLESVFSGLPRLNASFIIVHQMVEMMNELLRERLSHVGGLDVLMAEDGMTLEGGKVYIAPSDRHLEIVDNSKIRLHEGERVNRVRPSIDVAMNSIQARPGYKIVGIVVTGAGSDGAEGISHIKAIGGLTIAQNEKTCPLASMPHAAIATGNVDLVLSPDEIALRLMRLFGRLVTPATPSSSTAVNPGGNSQMSLS